MIRIILITGFFYAGANCSWAQNDPLKLVRGAISLTEDLVIYDPSYFAIAYPMGDVPAGKGVCTDVVIRAYRKIGIDLQQRVHEDMEANFELYPAIWGLRSTDTNIDHRRVPNLMTFFSRHGLVKTLEKDPSRYAPGDIVCWDLGKGLTHIGIVVNHRSTDGLRYQVVHNIGGGQIMEDMLFDFRIIGHYAYFPRE